MSKMRVHELAKQLEKDSKDIITILKEKGVEVKNHMSSITDEDVEYVQKKFSGAKKKVAEIVSEKVVKKEEIKKPEAKKEEPKKQEVRKEEPKKNAPSESSEQKKSHITKVFNPQNSTRNNNTNNYQNNNSNYNNRNNNSSNNSNGNRNNNSSNNSNNNRNNNANGNNNRNYNNSNNANRNTNSNVNANANNAGTNTNNVNSNTSNYTNNTSNYSNNTSNYTNNSNNNTGYNRNNNSSNNNNNNRNNNTNNNNNNNNNNRNNNRNNNNNNNRNNWNNQRNQQQQPKPQPVKKVEEEIKSIILPEFLTIKELADKMKMQASVLVKKLFLQGKMVTINQEVDYEAASEIALEFEIIAEPEEKIGAIEELLKEDDEDEGTMVKRSPVVCVMGHVDHGKTSLLDAIRRTKVSTGEAGGITQHIGAYTVMCNGEKITFLDTPGHEAFTAMRMRGAQATDIAILVVAADDGVMPQTVEAISHAKAAGISIIVAVNKIDKPSANIEKVKQELTEYELLAEDWGGDTVFVPVSAHTGEGIEHLLEMVLLTAEMGELKANPNRKARGIVIEAKLDKGRGPVATMLVQKGTLKIGDVVAVGSCYGRVRAMIDDKGERIKQAGPSTPVEILGLNSAPNAGEVFVSTANEKEARSFTDTYIKDGKEKLIEGSKAKTRMSLDDLFTQIQSGDVKELNIIVKADVQGSVEAVKQSLVKLSNEEVVVKVIHGGVGAINESDVSLASASNAIIIGFNVRPDNAAKETADREGVDLRLYRVIYQAIEDVEAAMKGMLDPIFEEKIIGHAEIRQLFKASGIGTIAGSYVLDGMFQRGCSVRITREGKLTYEGPLTSLKRFKDDVKEVKTGYECGFVFEKFNDLAELDIVEAYIMVEVPR